MRCHHETPVSFLDATSSAAIAQHLVHARRAGQLPTHVLTFLSSIEHLREYARVKAIVEGRRGQWTKSPKWIRVLQDAPEIVALPNAVVAGLPITAEQLRSLEKSLLLCPKEGGVSLRQLLSHGPEFPSSEPWISVKEALEGLPEATPHAASPVANHFPIDGARSYPRHLPSVMHLPAKTVKAGVHGVAGGENTVSVAGGGVRYFTLRELARLQTFPDSYEFLGPRSSIVRQIGNAVCCALAEELAAGALALIEQHYSAGKRRAI